MGGKLTREHMALEVCKLRGRMNGLAAAMKLRQLKEDLKIVAASAFNLSPQEVSLFGRILMKPFSSEELVDTVRSLEMAVKVSSLYRESYLD
jgi:CheY-like chemotaxis protein